jgi:transketolase
MAIREALEYKAIQIGRMAVEMTTAAGSGHPSTSLSLAHVTATLLYRVMRWNPENPWDLRSDRLVLSEGHAVPVVYSALIDMGVKVGRDAASARALTAAEVGDLRKADSVLDGHPNPHLGFPFFDAATGSLGQGLSAGAGVALAARMRGTKRRVFVVCGDGEMREGQVSEAIDFIVDQNITNLMLIVNCNDIAQSGHVSPQQSVAVLEKKLKAAGWGVRVVDGHNVAELEPALSRTSKTKPQAVLCRTVKGWGVKGLQGLGVHGKPLDAAQTQAALAELVLPAAPAELSALVPGRPRGGKVKKQPAIVPLGTPDFSSVMKKGVLSTRKAYGVALKDLGKANPQVVALDADVSNSTFSEYFGHEFPDRFVEGKIAEQNMVSVGAGMAAGGLVPFANSFGKFLVRAYDQIEMAAISGANLKLAGSHSGVTLAADGPSQMALVDVPFLRALSHARLCDGRPMARLLLPSDAVCAYRCVDMAARTEGLVYIRTLRPDMPLLYKLDEQFEWGGAKVLREGRDLTIVGSCYTTHMALAAADKLAGEGIQCGVVDCYSLPLDDDKVLGLVRDAKRTILVLDDSYVGSVGSELAEISSAASGARVSVMTVVETPKSAREPDEVLTQVGLGTTAVLARARYLVGK